MNIIDRLFGNKESTITLPSSRYQEMLAEWEQRGYYKGKYDGYIEGLQTIKNLYTGNPEDTFKQVADELRKCGIQV